MKEKTLRNAIEAALKQFQSTDFYTQSLHLFETLGYNTERQTDDDNFEIDDIKAFFEVETLDEKVFKEKVFYEQWASLQFLFQLTVEELHFKTPALFVEEATVEYQGKENYLFFALDLKPTNEDGQTYSRSKLAEITRRINRLSPTPVMILFRHDNHISFAIIDRRLSKKNNHEDVIERKVSIIKDINLVQPNRGHIEILHDLALPTLREKHEINTFLELHKAWKATLDLNLLNKKFYRELQNWYFWTLPQVKFPNDDPTKDEITRNAESVIRLITRIVFVWFLKEKDLVSKDLFDKNFIDGILAANKDNNSYYNAILQNLFFATLNRKMDERGFAIDKDFLKNKTEHSVYNLYRYEKLFTKDTDTILGYFKDIPFLNGGLFECLDTREGNKTIYIDGFSRNKAKRAQIPDFIFFGDETEADLSEFQGESKGSKYEKVRGLFNILNSYKFTVAENTPIEQEIALDPELLGQVFENLLAAYNPETKTSARKQTGSFYTPREIVDYMVDESLVAYLLQKFEERQQGVKTQLGKQQILLLASEQRGGQLELENNHALTEIQKQALETKLRHLVAYGDEPHLFSKDEAGFIVTALHEAKILDPACGSGAFPMGILLKMTHILNKIDPKNKQWKDTEINKRLEPYLQDKKQIEAIGYEAARKAASEKIDDQIEAITNAFDDNEADYARKLYLIENCIYGVDIQTIAVQISKLRFFISLVVHQKQDENKDNFGILPLPNLETKFVAANTLVGLKRWVSMADEVTSKEKLALKNVRKKHFSAKSAKEKEKYRNEDKVIREKIVTILENSGWQSDTARQVANLDPYNQNKAADFFDQEWMFQENTFDIIIGNPPYVRADNPAIADMRKQIVDYDYYETLSEKWDLMVPFYEKGLKMLSDKGVLAYIASNAITTSKYAQKLQKWIVENYAVKSINYFENVKVFDAGVVPIISVILKGVKLPYSQKIIRKNNFNNLQVTEILNDDPKNLVSKIFKKEFSDLFENTAIFSLGDLCYISVGIVPNSDEKNSQGLFDKDDLISDVQTERCWRPYIEGKMIDAYEIKKIKYFEWGTERSPSLLRRPTFPELYKGNKIMRGRVTKATFDDLEIICNDSIIVFKRFVDLEGVEQRSITSSISKNHLSDHEKSLTGKAKQRVVNSKRAMLQKNSELYQLKYILALINSRYAMAYLNNFRRHRLENYFYPDDFRNFPVPLVSPKHQELFAAKVEMIYEAKRTKEDTNLIEQEIDNMVYKLYNLSFAEVLKIQPDFENIMDEATYNEYSFFLIN